MMMKPYSIQQKRMSRAVLYGLCTVYTGLMIYLLFFFHRSVAEESIAELLRIKANFIPFHTIAGIIRTWSAGETSTFDMIWNILGNLLAFVPLAMALPCLFRPMRKWWRTIPTVAGTVVLVELLQLLIKRGMTDIDDLILNTLGAAGGYALLCVPSFRRLLIRIGWWKTDTASAPAPSDRSRGTGKPPRHRKRRKKRRKKIAAPYRRR